MPLSRRQTKTLDSLPLQIAFADGMTDVRPDAMIPIKREENGQFPFMMGMHKAFREGLSTGPNLTKLNIAALAEIAETLDGWGDVFETNSMYYWLRDFFTRVIALAIYGKDDNPIFPPHAPDMLEPFWEFNRNFLWLLPKLFPSIIAKKTYNTRIVL